MIYSEDIPFNRSFGYATREQVEKLYDIKSGNDYNRLKKQIEFQNKHKGKVKGKSYNG